MIARTIPTGTHGRYLVEESESSPLKLLVGFHGYAEDAEAQLERLQSIPHRDGWTLVSIQGLHRFYQRRTSRVVASWMTRQDRELAIADNTAYIRGVLGQVIGERPESAAPPIVFVGFSQGVAMAYRSACRIDRTVRGVVSFGGDVPPELDATALACVTTALAGRGSRDELYVPDVWSADQRRLREAGVNVQSLIVDAGHEWTPAFAEAVALFLTTVT